MNAKHDSDRSFVRHGVAWFGVALMSVSWLPGLGLYQPVNWTTWLVLVVVGWICMTAIPAMRIGDGSRAVVGVLSLPAMLIAPWPYRAGVLLFVLGCLIPTGCCRRISYVGRLVQRLLTAAPTAGVVLLIQALAVNIYIVLTSRSHELPAPLPRVLGMVTSLLGAESAVNDKTLALHSMRQIHRLATTYELLFDPATVSFIAAGIAILWLCSDRAGNFGKENLARAVVSLTLVILFWLPLRAGLLIALYLHDVLRTAYEAELDAMRLFWSTWLHLLLLLGPVLIFTWQAPRLPRRTDDSERSSARFAWRIAWSPLLAAAIGSWLVTVGLFWDPVGSRLAGRVVVEEHHPDPARIWEPTDRPYDTTWYGQASGYNYACIYDYCSHYFQMSRWNQPITADALKDCDVLVLKVPTRAYSEEEIEQVVAFVNDGGGLLLIGEHTNVYRTSDYLNTIARRFGFSFRADCLFGIDSVFEQSYRPPLVPHPIVQHIRRMDFATSCSIATGLASGRAPIRSVALKNKMADYHADNYYPQPSDDASMRYGAFVQLWATRYGKGRVVAFSDSTIFSNFCVFEPGKAELMLGMLEWLNHRSDLGSPRLILVVVGLLLAACSAVLSSRRAVGVTSLIASMLLGWSFGIAVVQAIHLQQMPPPPREREYVQVVLDRTLCDRPLSKNGFVDVSGEGFGVFSQWILRLGYFTSRREGREVFDANLVLLIAPDRVPNDDYLTQLDAYVRSGGVVTIVDDARDETTSNAILQRYGLGLRQGVRLSGALSVPNDWPSVDVDRAVGVVGGEPFAWIEGQPVATRTRVGAGQIMVIGFGSRFRDASMGHTMDVQPDPNLERVFRLEYALLRWMVSAQNAGSSQRAGRGQ